MEVVKIKPDTYITILDKDRTYFTWYLFKVKGPENTLTHREFRDHYYPVKVIPGEYL
jgi:hypothetical protein